MENLLDMNSILSAIPDGRDKVSYDTLTNVCNAYNEGLQDIHRKYRVPYYMDSFDDISLDIGVMNDIDKTETVKTDMYHKVRLALTKDVNGLLDMPTSI